MTEIGSVEDYDELRGLSAGLYGVVLVRQQKKLNNEPLSTPPNGGIFFWDEYSKEEDDRGVTIAPNIPRANGNGRWKRLVDDIISVKWFGAKGDMKEYYEGEDSPPYPAKTMKRYKGTINNSSLDVLILDQPAFSKGDETKTVVLWKDGIDGLPFVTTIESYLTPTRVTLKRPVSSSLSAINVAWGSDDTIAIQDAINVAKEGGYAVYLPQGHYIVTRTLDYTTSQIPWSISEIRRPELTMPPPYQLMKHGLRLFGAGDQATFLHNLIDTPLKNPPADYPSSRATIVIDGTNRKLKGSFQQTGYLKDFNITSNGHFEGTVGIDMLANFGYTIENVTIMNMGADGLIIRNRYIDEINKISDFDQTDKLRLDNVFLFDNYGWGIKIDPATGAISTSRIHIDRCNVKENKSGGIQWTGQGGTIERSGVYGNGMDPLNEKEGFGILVKNVKSVSDGLLITGCEIQDNMNVQVMIEIGANIRIIQNDFKADRLMQADKEKFSKVDIQVGDGNVGYLTFNPQDSHTPKIEISVLADDDSTSAIPNQSVILLTGTGISGIRTRVLSLLNPVPDFVPINWLVINNSDLAVTLKPNAIGSSVNIAPHTKHAVYMDKSGIHVESPRTVNACVIQDNRIKANFDLTGIEKGPDHTVVKVNTNAVGTVIGRWWISQFDVKNNPHWRLVDFVENDPITDKRSGVFADGHMHVKTHLQKDGIDGGHVLLPFAFKNLEINNKPVVVPPGHLSEFENLKNANIIVGNINDSKITLVPYNSEWSGFLVTISGDIRELVIANPIVRVVGAPLFFEFFNNTQKQGIDPEPLEAKYVTIKFDEFRTSSDYDVGNGFKLYRGERVTGILLFDGNGKWRLYTTWNCRGMPLRSLSSGPESELI
jgi:hypothetical protein